MSTTAWIGLWWPLAEQPLLATRRTRVFGRRRSRQAIAYADALRCADRTGLEVVAYVAGVDDQGLLVELLRVDDVPGDAPGWVDGTHVRLVVATHELDRWRGSGAVVTWGRLHAVLDWPVSDPAAARQLLLAVREALRTGQGANHPRLARWRAGLGATSAAAIMGS